MLEAYTFTGLLGCIGVLSGLVFKQNGKRIDKCEETQSGHNVLLREIHTKVGILETKVEGLNEKMDVVKDGLDSKIDTVITLIKNGGKGTQ